MKKFSFRSLFFTIPILFYCMPLFSQPTRTGDQEIESRNRVVGKVMLSGKITDVKTGEGLAGASVYFPDAKLGAAADAQGNYSFKEIPAGHYTIEVSFTGYTSVVEHLDLESDMIKDFQLQPSIMENQGVVVTGVSNATSVRKTPVPVTSVRKAELLQTPATNIIDALSKQPGVSQISTGPGVSKPIIRGLGYNRVVVVNEGVRQEGQQWGDEHGIEIDEMSVNRAEILKGPASLMYGSDALAGVINLITNVPVSAGTVKGNILTNYQTNSNLFGLNGNIAGNENGFNWNAYGSYKSSGDYENKYDGKVLNSRFNEKNFGGYIGVNKSWGYSHLIFSSFNQHLGLIEGDRDGTTGKFILYAGTPLERIATAQDLSGRDPLIPMQHIQHIKLISDNNFSLKKSRLKLNIGYQNNRRKEFGDPENPGDAELFFDMNTLNYNVQWLLPESKEWHTTVGVSGMYQASENKGKEVLIPAYNLFDAGAFVYVQRFYKKFTFSGGARFDNRSVDSKELFNGPDIKFAAFKKSFSNLSASMGFSYQPIDNITLKANIAHGFRAPNMAELGSNGVHEGTFRYEYGDNNLRSETTYQGDAGVEMDYEHFSFSLNTFYNRINDFIFYSRLSSVSGGDSTVQVNGEDITAYQFKQFDAGLYGFEMNVDLHPHPLDWLHFENSLSFVRGKFDKPQDGSNNLPLIPSAKWQSELRANFKKPGKSFKNLYIKTGIERNFRQDKPFSGYNTETATPAFTLWDAAIGTDLVSKKGNTILSIHFAGLNLADVAYQNHLSRLKYAPEDLVTGRVGIFNPGRNFSLKINVPIQISGK